MLGVKGGFRESLRGALNGNLPLSHWALVETLSSPFPPSSNLAEGPQGRMGAVAAKQALAEGVTILAPISGLFQRNVL